jgi:hypothetical protein
MTIAHDRAVEHRQKTITGIFDELPVVLRDGWLNKFAPMPFYAGVRSFLIASHEAAVTRDISRDDCSQTTWQSIRR